MSSVEEVLGFTASSWDVWRRERSDTMGSLIDGGLPAFSCRRRRGSRPRAEPGL